MNIYSAPPFVTAVLVLFLGLIVLSKNKNSQSGKAFFFLSLAITSWLFFASIAYNTSLEPRAELFMRICYIGITYISITLFHFTTSFLDINKFRKFSVFLYVLGLVGIYSILTNDYLISGTYLYEWGYYPKAGKFHPIFLAFFIGLTTFSVILLVRQYFRSQTSLIRKNQIKYVLIALLFFNIAVFDFLPNYGVAIYPFGYIPVAAFLAIIAYTIVKYRLLDTSIIITRTSIFIAVYSFVLGIPFALAFGLQDKLKIFAGQNWWVIPLVVSTILATGGPFIYLYIQRRAEDRLLQEQRRYQSTLRQASSGMGRIKDLKRLVSLIVHIVTRTVRIEHSCVYLFNMSEKEYYLGGSRFNRAKLPLPPKIAIDNALIKYLARIEEPVVLEEVSQRVRDYYDQELIAVEDSLNQIHAEVVVPSFVEERLAGLLVLGKKRSGKLYSQDDLAVFSILANQAALAIENAQFYEDMKKTHAQLLKTEKMATIGTLADGLSHQINNRLHAMGFIAGDLLDTVKLKKDAAPPPEVETVLAELEEGLSKIVDNVKRGGEIVEGLLKYTRKGDEGFESIELDKLINASLEMAQFKIKLGEIEFIRDYPKDTPLIKGNFTQLQEVFFNAIDNAYDAMMQRKAEEKRDDYKPQLRILAERDGRYLNVTVRDNGIGVKGDDREKLFTPFFTTKFAASKKGTGLGLYVMKKLVEDNHKGKLRFESKYMEGTTFMVQLPLA